MQEQRVSYEEMSAKYRGDSEALCSDHEKLIEQILEEEESLISNHRHHIDDIVDLVKQEMMLLHEVDQPGSEVEEYVTKLDGILVHKMQHIMTIRNKLLKFHKHLKTEEVLSKLYQQMTNAEGSMGDDEMLDA
jgi:kinesin family protein 2/24